MAGAMSHTSTFTWVTLFFEIVAICDISRVGDIARGHRMKKENCLRQRRMGSIDGETVAF